jgi:hypothetical protein
MAIFWHSWPEKGEGEEREKSEGGSRAASHAALVIAVVYLTILSQLFFDVLFKLLLPAWTSACY